MHADNSELIEVPHGVLEEFRLPLFAWSGVHVHNQVHGVVAEDALCGNVSSGNFWEGMWQKI